jgi:outer membrane PBP1 activator LpoA protein
LSGRFHLRPRSSAAARRNAHRCRPPRLPLLAVLILALSGCPSLPTPPEKPKIDTVSLEKQARALIVAQDYNGAGEEYLRLAATLEGTLQSDYRLRAARMFIRAGNPTRAAAVLDSIDPAGLDPALRAHLQVLRAHIALGDNRPEEALRLLQGLPDSATGHTIAIDALRLRARAHEALGDPEAALRARIELGERLAGQAALENDEAVWQGLLGLPPTRLQALGAATDEPRLAGWAELALIYMTAPGDPDGLERSLLAWRDTYPAHPAAARWVAKLIADSRNLVLEVEQVALLLPTAGDLARPAKAVRSGFLAAYLGETAETRPGLRLYTVGDDPSQVGSVYSRALAEGADAVVGPLRKDMVRALAESGLIQVPTLALNTLGGDRIAARELYQFGLSPEDEARQVARRAVADGHARGLLIAPLGSWGERTRTAVEDEWQASEGILLETGTYDPADAGSIAPALKGLLNLDASEARRRSLTRVLGRRLEFEPRPRKDVQAVAALGFPRQMRQIVPQLAFHRAAGVPVYATSHAYAGSGPEPDLEGLRFGDMPWMLQPDPALAELRRTLAEAFPDDFPAFQRLYALGWDAYRLIAHLPRLRAIPSARLQGATGNLHMDANRVVHRDLVWAQVREGKPQPLDGSPLPLAPEPTPGASAPPSDEEPHADAGPATEPRADAPPRP